MKDDSRKRSLFFLLLVEARKRVIASSNIKEARQLVTNLELEESADFWELRSSITTRSFLISVHKSDFVFYPTKGLSSYVLEPAVQNQTNASRVIEELFQQAGLLVEHPIKPVNHERSLVKEFLKPHHFVLVTLSLIAVIGRLLPIPFFVLDALASLAIALPFYVLFKNSMRINPLLVFLMASLTAFFLAINTSSSTLIPSTVNLFLLLCIVELLHHFILGRSVTWYRSVLLLTWFVCFCFLTVDFDVTGFLTINSLFLLSFTVPPVKFSKLRHLSLITGFVFFALAVFSILDFDIYRILAVFCILVYSAIMSTFGFRESPSRLFLGLGFLAL